MIHVAFTQPKHWAHLQAVWEALPDDIRGDIYTGTEIKALKGTREPVLVASYNDLIRCGTRCVLMEHGVGQSYAGSREGALSPGYPGGARRDAAKLFLSPNDHAAARDRKRYPRARVEVVGVCSIPRLQAIQRAPRTDPPTVALSTHWGCHVTREAGNAWGHWRGAFAKLCASGRYRVLGHAHPRIFPQLVRHYERMGAEPVASFDEVIARADCYVADNSSTLPEALACGIPVVVLDDPSWRQDVNHGGRFWAWADIGPRIIDPAALPVAIRSALMKRPWPGAEERLRLAVPDIPEPHKLAASVICAWLDPAT